VNSKARAERRTPLEADCASTCSPTARFFNLLKKGIPYARGRRFAVALTFPLDRETIKRCLDCEAAAGVILVDEAGARQLNNPLKIGYRFGVNGSRWCFPSTKASVVIILGRRDSIGLRIWWTALRHGVTSFVFVEPETGLVWRRSTLGFAARTIYHRVKQRSSQLTVSVAHWAIRFHLLDELIFASCIRRIRRMAKSLPANIGANSDTVFLVIGSLAPGGSERQVVNTALMINSAGYLRPIVVCARLGGPRSEFYRPLLEKAGIEIVDLQKVHIAENEIRREVNSLYKSEGKYFGYDEVLEDILLYLALFSMVNPKVVHAFLDENNTKAGIAAILARVPKIIVSTRSFAPDNFKFLLKDYMRPGYKIMLRRSEVVFSSNSYSGGRDYKRWLRKPSLKIHLVHNGIDFDAFAARDEIDFAVKQRLDIPSTAAVIVSVMRLSEEKQPLLWAETIIEISRRRPDVYFILVGDGPLRDEVEKMLELTSVMDRARLIAEMPDVQKVLRASDLFLLTSRIEGLPNTLIEAQAVGLPVVTTPAGGASEALSPGVTGLVAANHTAPAIADACLAILDDDPLRARMGETGPKFVRQSFSLSRMLSETMRLYKS
jgi:glycosyltransferase involved in cell wall biosynthesis